MYRKVTLPQFSLKAAQVLWAHPAGYAHPRIYNDHARKHVLHNALWRNLSELNASRVDFESLFGIRVSKSNLLYDSQ